MSVATNQTKTIDGVEYTVGMLPARRSARLLARIGRMVGPALGMVADKAGGIQAALEMKVDSNFFGPALEAFFIHTDGDAIDAVLMELAEVSLADGRQLKPIFDAHFMGKSMAMVLWARFALEVQYADFFGGKSSADMLERFKQDGAVAKA